MTRRCPRCGRGIRGPAKRRDKKQIRSSDICRDCQNADLIDQLKPAQRERKVRILKSLRELRDL